jgi:hypothetical protein
MKMSGHLGREMIDRYTHLRDDSVRSAAQKVAPVLSVRQMPPPKASR